MTCVRPITAMNLCLFIARWVPRLQLRRLTGLVAAVRLRLLICGGTKLSSASE